MVIVEICRIYCWDYYTYLAQPTWFIDMIIERINIDNKKAKQEEIKNKR